MEWERLPADLVDCEGVPVGYEPVEDLTMERLAQELARAMAVSAERVLGMFAQMAQCFETLRVWQDRLWEAMEAQSEAQLPQEAAPDRSPSRPSWQPALLPIARPFEGMPYWVSERVRRGG